MVELEKLVGAVASAGFETVSGLTAQIFEPVTVQELAEPNLKDTKYAVLGLHLQVPDSEDAADAQGAVLDHLQWWVESKKPNTFNYSRGTYNILEVLLFL